MSSQSESKLTEFLQNFSSISLNHKKPEFFFNPWVFWSEYEGSENNSSSADVGTPTNIHDKIISALSNIDLCWGGNILGQFWAPVTIGGRRLLSTSAQPFAVCPPSNELAKYRLNSEKYKYNIDIDDANKFDIEPDQMIKSGGPATAFLNCRTSISKLPGFLSELDDYGRLNFFVMIPICLHSQTNCIGVLEFTFHNEDCCYLANFIYDMVKAIKKAGLNVFYVQHLIPYTTINGLKVVKEEIEEALKVVCESHNLALAQVWIPYEDKPRVFLSSSLEDTQTKQLLAIKLTGCNYTIKDGAYSRFEPYFRFSDVTPLAIAEEFPLVTLQDYKSRYISNLPLNMVMRFGLIFFPTSALVICLRSNDTSDCKYVFEFMWMNSHIIRLDALLLTLKSCLPNFKLASGVEIGNELDVYIEGDATGAELGDDIGIHIEDNGTKKFKLFQGNRSMVVDYTAHSEVTCKTTPKVLPQEVIEKQFGNAMKDAAKNLNEWPGPNFLKRDKNDSSVIQFNTNEEDNGAIEDTSAVNLNKNVLTVNSDMSSQSESDSELLESELSEFLQIFSSISLHHKKPELFSRPWVFWSESEGSENNTSSADPDTTIIHGKIKSALSGIYLDQCRNLLGQFWAPVTIGDRRLLSTSAQPFSVNELSNQLAKYRLNFEKYKYNIDENKPHIEPDHKMIKSGGPATAFLNCRTSITKLQGFLSESDDYDGLNFTLMIPICFPSQRICSGVLEFIFHYSEHELARFLFYTIKEIKDAGLDVFYVQHLIPYKTINGLKFAKDEIEEALKVVCESHKLALAQVWIAYEDKRSLEDTQTKRFLAIKLTGYLSAVTKDVFEPYFSFGDVTPRAVGEELPLMSLQDHESRYISKLHTNMIVDWDNQLSPTSAFAICLKSNDTADFNYMFEFIWPKCSDYVICLEEILLTLKRCLPRFKFASGAELGDELEVILIDSSADDEIGETQKFKIFFKKKSSPMPKTPEKQKKVTVVDLIAPSKVTCKTTPKILPREVIEKQFGKTMKVAAESLNVSLSTLKRKSKTLGILEWPGPNFVKRNANGSSIVQSNTNEEDNGAIEDTSAVNLNKNVLTVKAEYEDDIIKFHLPVSEATFVHVEKEIGKRLELSDKTYKLKYLDEDGDWITIKSDEEMVDCIKSSRKSNQIVVRMRVLPSRQPVSRPAGS